MASDHEAIHEFFGLSYCNYMVLQRSLLQSMPHDWQKKFVELLEELNDEFRHIDHPYSYHVQALARFGETVWAVSQCDDCDGTGFINGVGLCETCDGEGEFPDCGEYRSETAEEIGFIHDPVPHYNRGRTRIKRRSELEDDG